MRERYQLNDAVRPLRRQHQAAQEPRAADRGVSPAAAGAAISSTCKLLIIGDEISKYATLRRAVHRHKLHKHVRFFGFVPDETLAVLYRLARRVRLPVALRGLRPAAARGDGQRHAGRHVERLVAAGGGRRRRGARSIRTSPTAIADAMRRVLDRSRRCARDLRRARAARGRGSSRGSARSRRVREIYDEVLAG